MTTVVLERKLPLSEEEARAKIRQLYSEGLEFLDIFRETLDEIAKRKKMDEISPRTKQAYDFLTTEIRQAIKTCSLNSI